MPFDPQVDIEACPICGAQANIMRRDSEVTISVNCFRCGDYQFESREVAEDTDLPIRWPEVRAVASYLIRQMNGALVPLSRRFPPRPTITHEFFEALPTRSLPSPAEASDNMLLYLAKQCGSSAAKRVSITYAEPDMAPIIGVMGENDVQWVIDNLTHRGLVKADTTADWGIVTLTWRGWERIGELGKVEQQSRYAFFARQFHNPDLDTVFQVCLVPTVKATGFELRTVTQRAGLVDAIIEDEIRRCAFLLADLSDDNAGAYWEAGFAEGLRKPVIYICKAREGDGEKRTHFDANHRHTVRWDLGALDATATRLAAVIRNTLPGRAQ